MNTTTRLEAVSEEVKTIPNYPVSTAMCGKVLGFGRNSMARIKRAMGVRAHKISPVVVVRFLNANPDFTPTYADEWIARKQAGKLTPAA